MTDPRQPPRVMTRTEVADYCRLTPAGLGYWVRAGKIPGPIPGTHRWDRHALDRALDRLSGLDSPVAAKSALAKWMETQDEKTERRQNSQDKAKGRV
jgi:hypothetical protein